jgi:hypothetical protein
MRKNRRLKLAFVALVGLIVSPGCRRPESSESTDILSPADIQAIRMNPLTAGDAMCRFGRLPLSEKRSVAPRLGVIIFDTDDRSSDFILAVGAEESPYPWTIHVRKDSVRLHGKARTDLVFRDDKWVCGQWGVYWTTEEVYDSVVEDGRLVFTRGYGKGPDRITVWIPATSWLYTGPKLERSSQLHPALRPAESVNSALHAFVQKLKAIPVSDLRSSDIITGDAAELRDGRSLVILVVKENLDQGEVAVLAGAQIFRPWPPPPAEYDSFVAGEQADRAPITDGELLGRLRAKLAPDLPGALKFKFSAGHP